MNSLFACGRCSSDCVILLNILVDALQFLTFPFVCVNCGEHGSLTISQPEFDELVREETPDQ